jgi:hypothetical protein
MTGTREQGEEAQMLERGSTRRRTALACLLFVLTLAVVSGRTSALALPGDGGSGTYAQGLGANSYNATVQNTGTTSQLFDYIQVPEGNGVTGCAVVSGFPGGTTCTVNGGGPRTAEVNIGPPGLAHGASGVFSFLTNTSLCNPNCPNLTGAINSDGDPNHYVPIDFMYSPPCPDITLGDPMDLEHGTQDHSYASSRTINGGTAPYTVAVTTGSLPVGVHVSISGDPPDVVFTGTPTEVGSSQFTVTVTDSTQDPPGPCSGTKTYTLTVDKAPCEIGPDGLPEGSIGFHYQEVVQGTGGSKDGYHVEVTGGSLPPGLTLGHEDDSSVAVIHGTPTQKGDFEFTIRVTDANDPTCFADQTYHVTITTVPTKLMDDLRELDELIHDTIRDLQQGHLKGDAITSALGQINAGFANLYHSFPREFGWAFVYIGGGAAELFSHLQRAYTDAAAGRNAEAAKEIDKALTQKRLLLDKLKNGHGVPLKLKKGLNQLGHRMETASEEIGDGTLKGEKAAETIDKIENDLKELLDEQLPLVFGYKAGQICSLMGRFLAWMDRASDDRPHASVVASALKNAKAAKVQLENALDKRDPG